MQQDSYLFIIYTRSNRLPLPPPDARLRLAHATRMPTGRAAADDAASDLALGGRTPSGSSSDSDDFEDEVEVAEEPLLSGSPAAWAGGSGMGMLPAEAEVATDSGSPAWGGSDVGTLPADVGG